MQINYYDIDAHDYYLACICYGSIAIMLIENLLASWLAAI